MFVLTTCWTAPSFGIECSRLQTFSEPEAAVAAIQQEVEDTVARGRWIYLFHYSGKPDRIEWLFKRPDALSEGGFPGVTLIYTQAG
jgi:hypothetical protein